MTNGDGDGDRGVGGLLWSAVKGVVQGVVVAVVLALFSPLIAREVARVNPTCDSSPGLVPVSVAEQIVQGRASVTSSPVAEPRFAPERAFDTRLNSSWAVPVERPTSTTVEQTLQQAVDSARKPLATLGITFDEPQDVRLMCVVNGHPLDPVSYRRSDRVQRMDVALSCLDEPATVVLRTMPSDGIHDRQDVPVGCPGAVTLELRLRQVYTGEFITDPATGERVEPTQLAALSEVTLYRPAERGEEGWNGVSAALHRVRSVFS